LVEYPEKSTQPIREKSRLEKVRVIQEEVWKGPGGGIRTNCIIKKRRRGRAEFSEKGEKD